MTKDGFYKGKLIKDLRKPEKSFNPDQPEQ